MTNIVGPASDVRAFLRFYRHDLAGRVQAVISSVELLDDPTSVRSDDFEVGIAALNGVVGAWREELGRIDHLLDGQPALREISSRSIIPQAGQDNGDPLPPGFWSCDLDALLRCLSRCYKILGRSGLLDLKTSWNVNDSLEISLQSGSDDRSRASVRLFEAFPGDMDAAFAEAEARLAGVSIVASVSDIYNKIQIRVARTP